MNRIESTGRLAATLRDFTQLFSLSIFQKILATLTGFLYLFVLSPAAYGAWRSLATFFQISIPGWTYLQTEFSRRRALADQSWISAWRAVCLLSIAFGFVAILLVHAGQVVILGFFPAAQAYAALVVVGSFLFLTNPLKNCFTLWWQVTDRFSTHVRLQAFEQTLYVALLLVGFFIVKLGVVAVPLALVSAHTATIVLSLLRWLPSVSAGRDAHTFYLAHLSLVWQIFRGEGKWIMLRESTWDWYEVGKVVVLNAFFPATTLGYLFAAETLASYVTSILSVLQPALQVRMATILDPAKRAAAFLQGARLMQLAAWILYLTSLPALYLLIHFVFKNYVGAFVFYSFFALQLPWAAIGVVLTPYWFIFKEQRLLFRLTFERYIVEMGMLLGGVFIVGALPSVVIVAHLVAGYIYTVRRLQHLRHLSGTQFSLWRVFFPERQAFTDAAFVFRTHILPFVRRRLV